ncbi:signal peptidase II [Ramlibacter sp. RBP-2]|uniref:Lipoprotein signal peptidase n=1 Tax=Ramlibacter lithotrophicus TaxID=2606681 RepID=A0A7X6I8T4_9BURK|nr:signal peptidase II [Ramlibacter lithotrophicus]NKE68661.1 signal peptidase II [Ramlibacter lithotrophicus]
MSSTPRLTHWHLLALLVLASDQAIKSLVDLNTPVGWTYPVTGSFNLVHVLNPGAAFSFLADAGGWQRWFFLTVAVAASAWLTWMLSKPRDWTEALAFSLILGGAMGNALDRALRGEVIDYLDFHLAGWHWPAFNLADVAILTGAVLTVVASVLPHRTAAESAQ